MSPLRARAALARTSTSLALVGLSAWTAGCLQEPPPDYSYNELDAAGEVFRVFCRRVARTANPTDVGGEQYYPICDGDEAADPVQPADDDNNKILVALVNRRPEIIDALRQSFGADPKDGSSLVDGTLQFKDSELSDFLSSLVPLYDLPDERVPAATRDIATMLDRVTDANDDRASKVIDTMARLSGRVGYRPAQLNLGALKPILSYEGLDKLADLLLTVLADGGAAHDEWLNILRAAALELADEPVTVDPATSTLKVALDLLFTEDKMSLEGPSGPLRVLQRDENGDALVSQDGAGASPMPTPFAVPGRNDDAPSRDNDTLALASNGQPMFVTRDANATILAAVMREASKLLDRGGEDRSGVENLAHGLKPLLGAYEAQTYKIGQNNYAFKGPDIDNAPLLDFVHALASLAKYPETADLLQVLTQLLQKNESEATAVVYAGLAINDFANKQNDAKLNGPHEFWDDLIDAGNQILERGNLLPDLIDVFTNDGVQKWGPLFAEWMTYNDKITYKDAPLAIDGSAPYTDAQKTSINAPVTQPLGSMVDHGKPDTGFNRSIWQRTMSLINGLNGVQVCNKKGAILNVPTNLQIVFTFPLGNPAGYEECAFIQFNDAVEVYSLSLLKKAKVTLKDDIASGLAAVGGATLIVPSIPDITEQNSQLTGFRDFITPTSMARFVFAPPNKFIKDLFNPLATKDGVPIKDYEPYALFPMEDPDMEGAKFIDDDVGALLVSVFDKNELRDTTTGKLPKGYMFGNLLSVFHKHWGSLQKGVTCAPPFTDDTAGCVQSDDPAGKFYSPGTNLVSYEPILANAFKDQDFIGILSRAAKVLKTISYNGKTGTQILSDFVKVLLTADPDLATRAGVKSTKTNTCVVTTKPDGTQGCMNDQGRIIPQYTPLYLMLDALKGFDNTFADPQNKDLLDIWHAGRSKLVDQLLTVDRNGAQDAYTYQLADRNAYAIALAALPWVSAQIDAHKADLATWSSGLSGRLGTILKHPLAAGVVDLLDAFWDQTEASGEFLKISSTLLDEDKHADDFRGMLVAVTDVLTLLHTDQKLSPAVQFAAIGLAPDAFDSVSGSNVPDVEHGALTAGLQLARDVIHNGLDGKDDGDRTTISKLLYNSVQSDGSKRSPAEVYFDATADVNRDEIDAPTEQTLSADEDRDVLKDVGLFLHDDSDDQRSLERLYKTIQARSLKGQ